MNYKVLNRKTDRYEFELLNDFDERFDNLWKAATKNHPMLGERTAKYLHWRFVRCPFKEFKIFTVKSRKSGNLDGYIVYRCNGETL